MTDWPQRAQEWHDACHEPGSAPASGCWCCCELCDPDWNPSSPNPYYTTAASSIRARVHE